MINLIGVECEGCKTYYMTKAETQISTCPKCNTEVALVNFDYDISNERANFLNQCHKEIKEYLGQVAPGKVSDLNIWEWIIKIDRGQYNEVE